MLLRFSAELDQVLLVQRGRGNTTLGLNRDVQETC